MAAQARGRENSEEERGGVMSKRDNQQRAKPRRHEPGTMLIIDEATLTGDVRAAARDIGRTLNMDDEFEKGLYFVLALADFLQLPDDTALFPALDAAVKTPTQLRDQASIARTRDVAAEAGYGRPISTLPGVG
jgi:hypothetical protein